MVPGKKYLLVAQVCDAAEAQSAVPKKPHVGPLAETVTVGLAAQALGLSEAAIRRKIQEGVWIEGRQYHRAPDKKIYIDLPQVTTWVRSGA